MVFDCVKYAALLANALPMVILNEAEYDQTISEIPRLPRKGEPNLSPEEDRLLDLLSALAEDWEEAHHPIPETPGYRVCGLTCRFAVSDQADLQPILGARSDVRDCQRQALYYSGAGQPTRVAFWRFTCCLHLR